MSARRIHEPNLKRYENSTGVGAIATSPEELRRHLEASRATWQRQVDTDRAYQVQATELEISKRTQELKERAKQRLMPTQKALEAAARLQVSLASVGAAATTAYNGQVHAARERDFADRVASAIGASGEGEDPINFEAGCGDGHMSCGAPTNETAERVGDVANRLMGYAEQEQNVLIQAGAAATEELRRVAAQASDEVAFVVSKSTGAIADGLQSSTKSAVDQISDTVRSMEEKVACVMVDTLARFDRAQSTMRELADNMAKCANAATVATQAATEAAEKISAAAVATSTAPAQGNGPTPTDAMCRTNSVVLYKSHMDILGISEKEPYDREMVRQACTYAMAKFSAGLPEKFDAVAIRAARTDAMAAFKESIENGPMPEPTKAYDTDAPVPGTWTISEREAAAEPTATYMGGGAKDSDDDDDDATDTKTHMGGMHHGTKTYMGGDSKDSDDDDATDTKTHMGGMHHGTRTHMGDGMSHENDENAEPAKPTGADASEEKPKEEEEPAKEEEKPKEGEKKEADTAAAPKTGFRAIFR